MTVLSTLRGGAGGGESNDDWERRIDEETYAVMTLRGGGESDDDWERRMDEETDAVMKERVKPSIVFSRNNTQIVGAGGNECENSRGDYAHPRNRKGDYVDKKCRDCMYPSTPVDACSNDTPFEYYGRRVNSGAHNNINENGGMVVSFVSTHV